MVSKITEYKGTIREVAYSVEALSAVYDELDDSAKHRLESSTARTLHGFSVDLVTPMIGQHTIDKDAKRAEFINRTLEGVESTGLDPLIQAEYDQAEKVGPLSIMLPFEERLNDIERYYSRTGFIDNATLNVAVERVYERFRNIRIKALSTEKAFLGMPKNTNLGYPIFSRDKKYLPEILDRSLNLERNIDDGEFYSEEVDPAQLFWRGQSQGLGKPPKQRGVWGQGHAVIIQELRLQTAALPWLRRMPEFAALHSQNVVDRVITRMMDESQATNVPMLSVDFSGYDTTLPPELFTACYSLMHRLFQDDTNLVNFCADAINNVPLITPIGVLKGWHTMPSGSANTNWWDSCMQLLWWEYVAIKIGNEISAITVQGDDGLVLFRRPFQIEHIEEEARSAGLVLSSDKGGISTDVVYYLQNVHMDAYRNRGVVVGVRPLSRALTGELSFETPRGPEWTAADTTLRWLQQVESCKRNPRMEVAARILFDSDKLLQNYRLETIIHMAGGMEAIEAALREKSFPYGKEPISGIFQYRVSYLIDKFRRGKFL
jgi:hypothetical protein